MSQIPAPLLSRQVGLAVLVLSPLAAAGLVAGPFVAAPFGFGWVVGAIVLAAVQQASLALAILLIGRSGLAGRHALFPALATLGSAGILVLDAIAEVVGALLAALGPLPPTALVAPAAVALVTLTALLLVALGVAVLRAAVVRPGARILPLLAGVGVAAAGIAVVLVPLGGFPVAPALAVLQSGGIALALFTPRDLQ